MIRGSKCIWKFVVHCAEMKISSSFQVSLKRLHEAFHGFAVFLEQSPGGVL